VDVWDVQVCVVLTGPGSGTRCPRACLCCSRWGGALPLPAARGFTHLWAHLDSRGTWPGALGQALAHCVWLSGALGPLGYWVGPLPGGLGALRLLGPGSGARPMSGRLGPGSVCCCPWFQRGLCPMLMGALSGGFLCSLLGGCVVVPAGGFLGSVLRGGCWWPGSCGPLCLPLIAGGVVDCGSIHLYTQN